MRTKALLGGVAAACALVLASPAAAHVTVTPAFLAGGETTVLRFDAPNERESEPMTALAITLPAGLETNPSDQPVTDGWTLAISGNEAIWSGGSAAPGEPAVFELRVRAAGEPGAVTIEAEQRYESGASVSWTPSFTVLPAAEESPSQHLGRALIATIVGIAVVAAGLLVLHRLRRRSPGRKEKESAT